MSTGWLSVGKSFQAATQKLDNAVVQRPNLEVGPDAVQLGAKRKSVKEDCHDKKKHKKDKKDKRKKDIDSPRSKKNKKDKKSRKDHRDESSTALVRSTGVLPKSSMVETEDFSSSDSEFSSSDDEPRQFNSTRSIIRQNRAEIVSGNSELTFLPNGEVVLLPSFARNDEASVSWLIDSRGDRNNSLYAGMQPSDYLYTVYPGATYITDVSKVPSINAARFRSSKSTQSITSAQQYRDATQRPSGIVVSAKQQLKEYDQANKTDQIFMHRTQLLSERRRETRLSNKYRYFSPAARSVVNDMTLNRLSMCTSTAQKGSTSDQTSNVSVMLPFSYLDQSVLSELGFATSMLDTSFVNSDTSTISSETCTYTSAAAKAQAQCNTLTRETNQALRQKPHDLTTILQAVSAQDTIGTLQVAASGRAYDAVANARTNSKTQVALLKSISERKIAILEQSIGANRNNEHLVSVLYEQLATILIHAKKTEAIQDTLARAVRDCPANVTLRMMQHTYKMSVFNESSCSMLSDSIHKIYTEVSQAALNALAAQQLNTTLLHNNLTTPSGMSLQQQYQHILLEQQLVQLQCDTLVYKVQIERSAGNTEKAVAMLQVRTAIELQILHSRVCDIFEYAVFWCFSLITFYFRHFLLFSGGAGLQLVLPFSFCGRLLYVLGKRMHSSGRIVPRTSE